MKKLLQIICLVLLIACTKEEPAVTTIEGTVINIGSKEPIDSVMVVLSDGTSTSGFFGKNENPGKGNYIISYTDKTGKFNISNEGNYPLLFLEKKGYRFVVFSVGHGSSDNYKTYVAGKAYKNEILELWADCFFKAIFKGKNCINTDSIYFGEGDFIDFNNKNYPEGYGNDPINHFNGFPGWKGIGDTYFKYWMKYQIQGVWHEKIDSVFIPSFTTYTDTIYY